MVSKEISLLVLINYLTNPESAAQLFGQGFLTNTLLINNQYLGGYVTVLNRPIIFAVFASAILLISIVTILMNPITEPVLVSSCDPEPFYVGVTYCGESVEEAKQLIDKVKSYTNLFVLQSGSLQIRPEEINQIVDYAVDSDLHFMVYFGNKHWKFRNDWFETFDHSWDDHFLGIYFGDEPGGIMLDSKMSFPDDSSQNIIDKRVDGSIYLRIPALPPATGDGGWITYQRDGTIFVEKYEYDGGFSIVHATYFTNGTIKVEIQKGFGFPRIPIENENNVPYSYEELWDLKPFKSYAEASDRFIDLHHSNLVQ